MVQIQDNSNDLFGQIVVVVVVFVFAAAQPACHESNVSRRRVPELSHEWNEQGGVTGLT
jgi:hypothetical protein